MRLAGQEAQVSTDRAAGMESRSYPAESTRDVHRPLDAVVERGSKLRPATAGVSHKQCDETDPALAHSANGRRAIPVVVDAAAAEPGAMAAMGRLDPHQSK